MVDPDETTAGVGGSASQAPEQWGAAGVIGDGRYRLTHRLGRGGMAEVFAAEDVRLGRTVAVKLLRPDLAEDPVSKARFTREAQSVAGLNHHAVVAVYDSGEDRTANGGTVPYIVMELVEGHTIRDLLLGSEPPPIEQALTIVSGVLEALAYSHRHGIVHRDIKPANVIITSAGAVKVMDFGIARALHGAASTMTQTGMVMGTPQYLSPEQALGKTVDARSDLYATGCLLYELLALRPPFTGETPLSVVYQHVQDDPRVPSEISDRVPPELDGLVLRSLAKQPDDRYQSAEEMRGVVQYALRMLQERGGNTGGWDTGMVPQAGAMTPGAGTTRPPRTSTTAQFPLPPPLLAGRPGGGGDDVHGYDAPPPSDGGNRWLKPVLFVLAAAVAIALGVYFATQQQGGNHRPPGPQVSTSQTPSTPEATTGPNETPTAGGGRGTGGGTRAPSGSYSQGATASQTQTQSASPTASASPSASESATSASPSASSPPPPPPTTTTQPPTPTGTAGTGAGPIGGVSG